MMRIFLTLLFILYFFPTLAQDRFGEGYYITNDGDTIHGFIRHRARYVEDIKFRANLKAPVQKLPITAVKGFGFAPGRSYARVDHRTKENPSGDTIFVKPYVEGEIDLYSYHNKLIIGSDKRGRFVLSHRKGSNDQDALHKLQTNLGAFNVLFQDCPDVRKTAQTSSTSKKNVIGLIHSYHDCINRSYRDFNNLEKRKIDLGFYAGRQVQQLTLDVLPQFDYSIDLKPSSTFTLGMTALIWYKRPSPIFALETGLAYSRHDHTGRGKYFNPDYYGTYVEDVVSASIRYDQLTLPVGIRLTARSNVINPYIGLGLIYHQVLSQDGKSHQVLTIDSTTEENEMEFRLNGSYMGGYICAGLRSKLGGGKALFAEWNYEGSACDVSAPYSDSSVWMNVMSLKVGLLF